MHSVLHPVDNSANNCWMNEWPSTELPESWIFCYSLWISPYLLWSLSHCLPHFNPGLYRTVCLHGLKLELLLLLFLLLDLEVTSSVHCLLWHERDFCSFVLFASEGCVYACLIFNTPFSWPGMKVSHLQRSVFTTQAQTDPCENSNKSA